MTQNNVNSCGCYERKNKRTPVDLSNSPGLSALKYRVGTHSQFKADMLEMISHKSALKSLTTREDDDLSIAILDCWATIADVLSFYQERIVNEGYLRTATEKRSALELARAIGYELKPGVAASVPLVFMVDNTAGALLYSRVDEGTKIVSSPGQDEQMQIFETIETIEAKAALNDLKPLQFVPTDVKRGLTELYLKGVNNRLVPGDAILLVGLEREGDVTNERWDFRVIQTVTVNPNKNYTHITWQKGIGYISADQYWSIDPAVNPTVFVFRQRSSFFGYNAPDWKIMPEEIKKAYDPSNTKNNWPDFDDIYTTSNTTVGNVTVSNATIHLDAVYPKILPESWIVLAGQRMEGPKYDDPKNMSYYVELCRVNSVEFDATSNFTLNAKTTKLNVDIIGNNPEKKPDRYIKGFMRRDTTIFCVSEPLEITDKPLMTPLFGNKILLDRKVPELKKGQRIIVQGKTAKLKIIKQADLSKPDGGLSNADVFLFLEPPVTDSETNTVTIQLLNQKNEKVTLKMSVNTKITDNMSTLELLQLFSLKDTTFESLTYVANQTLIKGYENSRVVIAPLDEAAPVVCDVASIADLIDGDDEAGNTLITLDIPEGMPYALSNVYDLDSVHIYANVALATHGETVHETLGSGDSSTINQHFRLKKTPLTYVSAVSASGAKSTVKVYVNDVQWKEVPTLYGSNSQDHVFTVRIEDNGDTLISFGDGKTGVLLPNGTENITATYRSGIGLEGTIIANKLSMLPKKPFGIRSVTNPIAASGAAPPEKLEDVQVNAPSTVLTLDRIVSLKDYESFARNFLGVAKASASAELENGDHKVKLIVAPLDAQPLDLSSVLCKNLKDAITEVSAYGRKVLINSFIPIYFNIHGTVHVDPKYFPEKVKTDIEAELRKVFSFEQSSFNKTVTLSDILAVIHTIPGIIYVNITSLDFRNPHPKDPSEKGPFNSKDFILSNSMLVMIDPKYIDLEVKV